MITRTLVDGEMVRCPSRRVIGFHEMKHEMDAADTLIRLYRRVDEVYTERNLCVAGLAHLALKLGYVAGKIVGPREHADTDDEWNLVLIDLPGGQVSWHIHETEMHYFDFLPLYEGRYDDHSSEEKYRRVLQS